MTAEYPAFDGSQNCADSPVNWFPDGGQHGGAAKRICNGTGGDDQCPFFTPCLEHALHHSLAGIWAATTEHERRLIRKKRGIVAKPLSFGTGPTNTSTAKRMASRGTPVTVIAAHLGVTAEAVHRILRGADVGRKEKQPGGIAPRSTCPDCGADMLRSSLSRHRARCVAREQAS